MDDYSLTINNKKVFEFYKDNPNIDIVNMNLIIIDLINGIGSDLSSNFNNNLLHEISLSLNNLQHQNNFNKKELFSEISSLNNSFKSDIIEFLSSNQSLEKQNLNQNFELYFNKIQTCLPQFNNHNLEFFKDLLTDVKKDIELLFSRNASDSQINAFIANLDSKFNSINAPLYNLINNNQNLFQEKISNIESSITHQHNLSQDNFNKQSEFFNRFKNNSQFKGQISENICTNRSNKTLEP